MDETLAAFLGAIVGAAVALIGTFVTAWLQARSEHDKWTRNVTKEVYSETLRTIARALVVPIGTDTSKLEKWFREIATLREHLVSMQVYCDQRNDRLSAAIRDLFQVADLHDFVRVATEGKLLRDEYGETVDDSVLMGVVAIRRKLISLLNLVAESARQTLGKTVVTEGSLD